MRIKLVLWAEHVFSKTPGSCVSYRSYDDPHEEGDDDVIIIEGDCAELLEIAMRYRERATTFGRNVCRSILEHLEYERILVRADLYSGCLYYDDEDSFRPVSSGGVDTGLKLKGSRVFRAGGVVTDEGDGAELPIDADCDDIEVCWVMP